MVKQTYLKFVDESHYNHLGWALSSLPFLFKSMVNDRCRLDCKERQNPLCESVSTGLIRLSARLLIRCPDP